jgi:hypothetical protein
VRGKALAAEVKQTLRERAEWLEGRVEELKCDVRARQCLDDERCKSIALLLVKATRVREFVQQLVNSRRFLVRAAWVVRRLQQALAVKQEASDHQT